MKVFEAQYGIDNGAEKIDMVMNIGALKSGDEHYDEHRLESYPKK